ncbi:MAG: ATP-dependent Clp protease proteolytic subunit [Oscillospiraceae bacterium]|nr:ATP-dependent Clp protease proteolytic subunit [Oscillospiraceae bacterium]
MKTMNNNVVCMGNPEYLHESSHGTIVLPIKSKLLTERNIFVTDQITSELAVNFVQQLMYLSEEDKPVNVYINSPGGEVTAGLLMYDAIQSFEGELNLICMGNAASMAAVLLAAGQKGRRFITPHGKVMIHEVLVKDGIGGSATNIAEISKSILETRDLVNGILAKHTGKSLKEINKQTSFDNFMNAEKAIAFGICDKVVNNVLNVKGE